MEDRAARTRRRVERLLQSAFAPPTQHEVLQAIAEGVTDVLGFGVAAVSVVRDSNELEVVAVAGDEGARDQLMGSFSPRSEIDAELAVADHWGALRFVPHTRLPQDVELGWIPDFEPDPDDPNAWHPLDLLVAPLNGPDGTMRGLLSVDLPADGQRPGPETRAQLELYAAQASRALVAALEREALQEKARLATATRAVVRAASARLSLAEILSECQEAILTGLRVQGFYVHLFDDRPADGGDRDRQLITVLTHRSQPSQVPSVVLEVAEGIARRSWAQQRVAVVSERRSTPGAVPAEHRDRILKFLANTWVASTMVVPLGAAQECLGVLLLARDESSTEWSDVEAAAALDIGHDLGGAVLNARLFDKEHRLVAELQALDHYKNNLLTTVSHEVRTPLTAIVGHAELLLEVPGIPAQAQRSLDAIQRAAERIDNLVDDLIVLSKISDPDVPLDEKPVDLVAVVEEVIDLLRLAAAENGVDLHVEARSAPLLVRGDATMVDRLVQNLLGNAVKYSPDGGRVTVTLDHDHDHDHAGDHGDDPAGEHAGGHDRVRLQVADEGIGIAPGDLPAIFTEFFRSEDARARSRPGSGLGLTIVQEIVRRHGGTVGATSTLGEGSTFTVTLPAER